MYHTNARSLKRIWMTFYTIGVIFLLSGLLLNLIVLPVQAEWDGSDLVFTNGCSGNCDVIQATICNNGAAMQGTTTYQVLWKSSGSARTGDVIHSGTVPILPAGQCAVLSFNPLSISNPPVGYPLGNFIFRAQQRPDYAGDQPVVFSSQCRPFKDADECRLPTPTPTAEDTATPTNTPETPTATFTFTPTDTPVTPTPQDTEEPTPTPVTPTPQDTEEPTPTPVTPTPQETIEITETSVVRTPVDTPPPGETATPAPTDQPPPPPTLPPPPPSTTVLIPVTGGNLMPPVQAWLKTLFTYLGLLLLGVGMVVQGAGKWMR
ncbi:hypothetical protein BECAL_00575 [Bellilinea caldifistulae]|uniref:hypothetical protein n=1 Tax=Bellilinea caldifistulae TaxID=360411 RepID=UPI0007823940|nr:hypothetical protein [Bellilinea caldifistulae]GAP09431.1 hypothetical protein BECAL_00575 [Bellilinea caldifistulae]